MNTTRNWNKRLACWAGCLAVVSAIVACGGGGDSGVGIDTPPIGDARNNVNAVDDVFPAIQSAVGGSTTPVQLNDTVTIDGTTTAAVLGTNVSIAAVTRTSAAPAAGSITLNTSTGVVTIASGTSAGAFAFSYQLCRTAPNQAICAVAKASGIVSTTPPASDVATRADILNCPRSAFLISSSNWSSCLAGKRLVGNDPILTAQTCQIRYLVNGGIEYTHNGVLYEPSVNGPADGGLYQNTTFEPSVKLMFGILDWDLSGSTARNRVTKADLSVNVFPDTQDLLVVTYFDSGLARRTLNCNLTGL
jgi:hypothetical protein